MRTIEEVKAWLKDEADREYLLAKQAKATANILRCMHLREVLTYIDSVPQSK